MSLLYVLYPLWGRSMQRPYWLEKEAAWTVVGTRIIYLYLTPQNMLLATILPQVLYSYSNSLLGVLPVASTYAWYCSKVRPYLLPIVTLVARNYPMVIPNLLPGTVLRL